MSARHDERTARKEWLQSVVNTKHDEHDADTDPEPLPPLGRALAGLAVLLVVVCGFIGWALPIIADKVIP